MNIVSKAYPRAALIGNPSDGYFGKTIAFVFDNFQAEVIIEDSPVIEIVTPKPDRLYRNLNHFENKIEQEGYYGGNRLIKAAMKVFVGYCREFNISLDDRNFRISYQSTIPRGLGLAGSSAIITACMKGLMKFFQVTIDKPQLANLILAAEQKELHIEAGLQDRVAQVYQKPVFMDFNESLMKTRGYGLYQVFDKALLKNIFIAYSKQTAQHSGEVHNQIRQRWNNGDHIVIKAMNRFADIAAEAFEALKNCEVDELSELINENYNLRKSTFEIREDQHQLIELARSLNASAKFTGSGGAIIGTFSDEDSLERMWLEFNNNDIELIIPNIVDL